jgi:hypothetical protein
LAKEGGKPEDVFIPRSSLQVRIDVPKHEVSNSDKSQNSSHHGLDAELVLVFGAAADIKSFSVILPNHNFCF